MSSTVYNPMMIELPDWLADVEIRSGRVPEQLEQPVAQGVLWQADKDRFLIEIPGVARYLVRGGTHITIEPLSTTTEHEIARFLYMTPMAAILYQRGSLAFHAAAYADGGEAILLAGDSGAGKSTLLAAGWRQGREILADELAAVRVDDHGRLWLYPMVPAMPEIRLWRSAAVKLFSQQDGYTRIGSSEPENPSTDRENWERYSAGDQVYWPWITPAVLEPLPLKAIFRLSITSEDKVAIKPVTGAEAFQTVGLMTYNSQIADALYDRVVYLRLATAVVNAVPIYMLQRPRGHWSIAELLELIANI